MTPATLAARITETACVTGPFTLPDGRELDSYFDEYRLACDPHLLRDVAAAMAALVPDDAEAPAGFALGGVPLTVALSAATGLPAVFLRREPKRYGSRRQIEGTHVPGRCEEPEPSSPTRCACWNDRWVDGCCFTSTELVCIRC